MRNIRIPVSIILVTTVLSLIFFIISQPSALACTVSLGKKDKFDMEISPKVPLFNPTKDGYFYPGSPKVTKNLEVKNVGDTPFKIYKLDATFHRDTRLGTGLQIKIEELGNGKSEKPNILYSGVLSRLSRGVEVSGSGQREIPERKSVTLLITVWMPEKAGNEYQGLSMTADIAITVQYQNANQGGKC